MTKHIALQPEKLTFTPDQLALIKRTIAVGATDDELQLFLYQAKRTGLDPLSRQIYFVKRQGKGTIQTSIDGFRVIADRTGGYAGSDDALYDTEKERHPEKATVTVWRLMKDIRVAFTATARWNEYVPVYNGKIGSMWEKMPYLMLAKCAEALALRKAFPQDLSGLYTDDEMQQADATTTQETRPVAPVAPQNPPEQTQHTGEPRLSLKQRGMIQGQLTRVGKDMGWLESSIFVRFGKSDYHNLTVSQASQVIEGLLTLPNKDRDIHQDMIDFDQIEEALDEEKKERG